MKRVAVTGYAVIDSLGDEVSSNFDKLLDDKCYIRDIDPIFVHEKIKTVTRGFFPDLDSFEWDKHHPRGTNYAFHVVDKALKHAQVPESSNVGVVFSTISGGKEFQYEIVKEDATTVRKGLNCTQEAVSGALSTKHGFKGVNVGLNAACATGLFTIDYAMRFVDEYDYMVVGGSDTGINIPDFITFTKLRALSNESLPFDKKRNGFVMGEGAGCLILESEEKAKARGATIYGYIHEVGFGSDASNQVKPSGEGADAAIRKAIAAGGRPDAVNGHITGTPVGDVIEYDIIRKYTNAPIYTNKIKIGHTFAAAGIIETIYSFESMNRWIVPPVKVDVDEHFDVSTEPIKMDIRKTLKNSFGFGGRNAAVILERGDQ